MRTLMTMLVTVLMLNVAALDDAHARKLGFGKSFGKSFSTSPTQRKQQTTSGSTQNAGKSSKRGLLGGIFGGLLVGGLLASLFGGAFEGLQFMDILLFGGLAFVLFKLFRGMQRAKAAAQAPGAAYAGPAGAQGGFGQPDGAPQSTPSIGGGGFGGASDVPFNLPPGFDPDAFLSGARDHYHALQEAWNRADLEKLREFFSPELFEQLSNERQQTPGELHTEVQFLDVVLGRADHNAALAQVSLRFSGRYRDTVEGIEEDISDIWHLERDLTQADAPWMIVGIEN